MAVTATPAYPQTPRATIVQADTANTNRNGSTGTYTTSIAAGSNGTLIDYILFQAITTTVAGLLRIFFSADNSTNWRMIGEVLTAGATVSGTVPGETLVWVPAQLSGFSAPSGIGFVLPASSGIRFNVNNGSETWNCILQGGDF